MLEHLAMVIIRTFLKKKTILLRERLMDVLRALSYTLSIISHENVIKLRLSTLYVRSIRIHDCNCYLSLELERWDSLEPLNMIAITLVNTGFVQWIWHTGWSEAGTLMSTLSIGTHHVMFQSKSFEMSKFLMTRINLGDGGLR